MVRRATRSKANKIYKAVVIILVGLISLIVILFITTRVLPVIFAPKEEVIAKNIIAPVGTKTTVPSLTKKLEEKNFSIESIKYASDSANIEVELNDGPKVLFSKNQDVKWQVDSVILILQHLTVNSKKPTLIDLTSTRPIVKF